MNPELEKLIELQQTDRETARLQSEVAALPRRVAAIEAKLAGTRSRVEAARAALKTDEANRRKYETQISDLRQKISKYRDQSLEVKTNDQYRALMNEIQFAERDIAALEDKILEIMVGAESREAGIKELEAELKSEIAEIEREKEAARSRTAEDEAQLAQLNARHRELRSGIQEHVLRHYERVMKFRGSAISEVIGHKCAACQVMLRPQVYNEVKTNDQIVTCDSCQRILYFVPEHQPPEEGETAVTRGRKAPSKAWYYLPDYRSGIAAFAAFVTGKGNSSMRVYDAETGQKLDPTAVEPGDFKAAFSQYVREGTRIRAGLHEDHLEEWGEQLPEAELTNLRAALHEAQAAEAEAAARQAAATGQIPVAEEEEEEEEKQEESTPQA